MAQLKWFLLCLCMAGAMQNACAQRVVLSGKVTDPQGETLIGVSIKVDTGRYACQTNNYGFYSISLPRGQHEVMVHYVGNKADTFQVSLQRNTERDIVLQPLELTEVVISADNETQKTGAFVLPLQLLARIPTLAGEQDVLKAMTFTPGVATGTEGTVGLHVRGGSPDQNLILLDDAVVYNPAHLFGFLSVFNPDALKQVELIKGNGPARYGGRTSSVLNIRMKDGNQNKVTGAMGLGIISSRGLLEGPLWRKKGTFMVAGRAAYLGLVNSLSRIKYKNGKSSEYTGYNLADFNAKLSYPLSDKTHLFFSAYSGVDQMEVFSRDTKTEYLENALTWGNATATARLNTVVTPRVFLKNMLVFSRFFYKNELDYHSENEGDQTTSGFVSKSGVTDFTGRSEVDFFLNNRYTMRFGAEASRHWFKPRDNSIYTVAPDTTVQDNLTNRAQAVQLSAYTEQEISLTSHSGVNLGVRINAFLIEGKQYTMAEPRLSAHWEVSPQTVLRGSFTGGQQCLHLLSNAGLGLQNDVWVPVTGSIRPQRVWQGAIGVSTRSARHDVEYTLDLFYKKLFEQIEYREGSTTLTTLTRNWYDLVTTGGIGTSKGVELGVTKKSGRFTGLFAYTWSKTDRLFTDLNNGNPYPYLYDYTHNLNATGNISLGPKWDISATWVWHTGSAISLPTAILNGAGNDYWYHYKNRNNARLPDYMRADIGLNRNWTGRNKHENTFNISIYNALNRKNPLYAKVINEVTGYDQATHSYQYSNKIHLQGFIPIIPSVSYSVKF